MSAHVQLTVGSSENLADRGSLPVHGREARMRTRVCRNLFGPVDHDELRQEIESKLREISERDEKRWNFNFSSGTPLDGDYEWEEASETSPGFYQESVQVGKRRVAYGHVRQSVEVTQRENEGRENTEKPSCGKVRNVRRKTTTRFTATRITDFYGKRRNSGGLKRLDSVSEKPFVSLPEQTPRKRIR
ncbi:cyclin-dependent kinase inhibitor 1C [Trichomycterus rosablanca]|uniref:cyclin-dependent kinase inhibitor 1C n=1 Tax=Trichomycterus rosablanca TaxID=2290929 RepID=UPI002F35CA50